MRRTRVWDLPTRLFHWALAAAVAGAFIAEEAHRMDLHAACGLTALGLVAFRVAWGFLGGTYARFTQFVRGPASIRDYLAGRWQGVGHNPLGALSVIALLGVVALQATLGLFSNDDSTFFGPLYDLVPRGVSDAFTEAHEVVAGLVVALVGLHLAAIAWYVRVRKQNLVKPMLTGWQDDAPDDARDSQGGGLLAFVVSVAFAAGVVYLASGALLPAPTPVAAPVTPAW